MKIDIADINRRFNKGDPLTNKELISFIDHMRVLFEHLDILGPEYRITANHILHQLYAAESFARNRKLQF